MRTRWWAYFVVIFPIMFISKNAMCGCREEGFFPIPGLQIFGVFKRECTFANTTEFRKAPELKEIETYLNMDANKIPESATDIYYFCESGRDSIAYFSLKFSSEEESVKFTERLANASISEFQDEIIDSRSIRVSDDTFITETVIPDFIFKGPAHYGKKWETPYWNLKEVKKGKFFIKRSWNYIFIDLDTHRVYLCVVEM